MKFIVVQGSSFDALISDPTMEALMDTLDYGMKTVTLKRYYGFAVLEWLPEFAQLTTEDLVREREGTDSEDFTSSS